MDYYYALLESYEQLKRRKFKLSLREAEGEEEGDAAGIIAQVGQGKTEESPGELNGVEVWEQGAGGKEGGDEGEKVTEEEDEEEKPDEPKEVTFVGRWAGASFSAMLMKGSTINPNDNANAEKMISALLGKGEAPEDGDTEGGDTEEDAASAELDRQISEEGIKARDSIQTLLETPGAFPGLKTDTKHTRRPESLANVARGETQGFTGQVADMEERILNSGKLPPEEKLEALQNLNKTLETLTKVQERGWGDPKNVLADPPDGMSEQEAAELGEILGKMEVTPQGVLIDGVAIFYRGDSTRETDALRNAAEQLDAAAKVYNSQFDNIEETETNPKIAELKEAPPLVKSGGAVESFRGPVAEKFMRCSAAILRAQRDFADAKTPAERRAAVDTMRKELGERYEEAVADGSLDKMVDVFGVGRSVALGEIIANRDQMSDAQFVETCQKVLEERGMDPDKAADLITQAGGVPPERGVMMSLLVTTMVNQHMDEELFGDNPELIPDNIVHEGDTDSGSSGKKADLVFEWDDEEKCKQIAAHYAKKLGSTPKESGCGGEGSGAGVENMVTPKEGGGCRMEVELKTLTASNGKGGAGELSQSRSTAMCDDAPVIEGETTNPKTGKTMSTYDHDVLTGSLEASKGMTPATKEFADANKARLNDCGGEGTVERACEKHKEIQKKVERYTKLLTPGTPGVTPERSMALLDNWWKYKTQDEKGKARYEAAKRAVNGSTDKADLDALKKVKEDLQQQVFKREIHRTAEGAGAGTGKVTDPDMQDYLLMNYSQACGSTKECLRVTRGLQDGGQSVYLNNATVESNMQKVRSGEASFEYAEGGTIINLVDKDGNVLAKCDTGRGISKWTVGKGTRSSLSESIQVIEPNLFLEFLTGQASLIEKLMNQTT